MAPSATTCTETITPLQLSGAKSVVNNTFDYFENGQSLDETKTPKELVGDALKKRIEKINHEICEAGDEDAFFVADMGEVYRQHLRWKKNLKRVKPFYGKSMSLWVIELVRC